MVTDQQIRRLYKLSKTEKTEEIAAAKAGMDVKTARMYLRARRVELSGAGAALRTGSTEDPNWTAERKQRHRAAAPSLQASPGAELGLKTPADFTRHATEHG
jgi:hypothetical protein